MKLRSNEFVREGWRLTAPAYEGGSLAPKRYDAGTGLVQDTGQTELKRAYMMCVSDTSENEFTAYTEKLLRCGYVLDSQNERRQASAELYRQYRKDGHLLSVSYNEARREARVIQDPVSTPESEFEYSFRCDASTETEIYMYGMKYHPQGLNFCDTGEDPDTRRAFGLCKNKSFSRHHRQT